MASVEVGDRAPDFSATTSDGKKLWLADYLGKRALVLGSLFGLITYATYDLTNLATVKNWPWIVTVVDLFWGAALAASVSYLGFLAGKWLR